MAELTVGTFAARDKNETRLLQVGDQLTNLARHMQEPSSGPPRALVGSRSLRRSVPQQPSNGLDPSEGARTFLSAATFQVPRATAR